LTTLNTLTSIPPLNLAWHGVAGLAAAVAVGMVIGLERGWRDRDGAEGTRVAGLRTFALIGLLGGVLASIMEVWGPGPLSAGMAAMGLLVAVSYRENVRVQGSLSATTAVAALLTYALGALAAAGHASVAVGAAVLVAVLLDLKPRLHHWLRLVEHRELSAALQLGVLSAVILPLLPDSGHGPYQAINPYRLWLAVCLVAALSLGGHLAIRLTGPQRGLFWTGLLGGLASSMAATLMLARRARIAPRLANAAAAGTLAACASMFVRLAAIVVTLKPELVVALGLPLLAAAAGALGAAWLQWRSAGPLASTDEPDDAPVFDLTTALGMGLLLGVLAVLSQAAMQSYGMHGLYALAAVSGLADVDALLISVLYAQPADGVALADVAFMAGIAVLASLVAKAGVATVAGNARLGRKVAAGYALAAGAGALVLAMLPLARAMP
jgi:uncharacterized membrane protein (DUF4010 family)